MLRSMALRAPAAGLALLALACGDPVTPPEPETARERVTPTRPTAGNQPPQIRSLDLEPSLVKAGERVRAVLDASDPDGDPLRIEIVWSLDGDAIGAGQSVVVPEQSRDRELTAEVTIDDGAGHVATERAALFVENSPPEVVALRFEPETPTADGPVTFQARGVDPDGDPLRFDVTWSIDGSPIELAEPSLPPRYFERGSRIQARIRAHDGNEHGPAFESDVIVVSNAPPRFTSSPTDFSGETTLRTQLRAEDPDGDRRLRFRLVDGPDGLGLDPVTGEIEWTPSADQAGTHRVEVAVEDGAGGEATQEFELQVGGAPPAATP